MDYPNKNIDPWDDGVFGTGNTEPPKNHSGIIALLLILVIFLSGIVSLLSFMNIKLFHQLSEQKKELAKSPMSVMAPGVQPTGQALVPQEPLVPEHVEGDMTLKISGSPQSVENVPEPDALSWQEIYEKNNPSVVSIATATETGSLSGSGVILSEQGFIVTTCHLIRDARTITVTCHDGTTYDAHVVGTDPLTDLALIHVLAENMPAAEFGDSSALRVGDSIAAMGGQMNGSLNNGLVSAINRDVPFLGQNISLIQSNVLLSAESAGGPLINCYGQVVGIHTSLLGSGEGTESTGFAIPSATVKQIVDQLLSQGFVSGRPTLGMSGESITSFDRHYFHIPDGLYLTAVDPSSDAYRQGIAPGDILLSLEGHTITTQSELDVLINGCAIGDVLTAVVFRNGQEETFFLTVTEFNG
jgi:serine protease Do